MSQAFTAQHSTVTGIKKNIVKVPPLLLSAGLSAMHYGIRVSQKIYPGTESKGYIAVTEESKNFNLLDQ